MYITRSAQDIARDAVQIFGGRGITKTGMGKHIEHVRTSLLEFSSLPLTILRRVSQYHRTVPFDAILGGGEQC